MSEFTCPNCGAKIDKEEQICPNCQTPQLHPQQEKTSFGENAVVVNPQNNQSNNNVYCRSCGASIKKEAEICPQCGVRQTINEKTKQPLGENESEKSRLVALLLWFFLGGFGAHRFYAGRIGSGITMLLIGWLTFGIWHIIDLILILSGSFKDENGKLISRWDM